MLRILITLLIMFNSVGETAVANFKSCLDSSCKAKYQEEIKREIVQKREERYRALVEKTKENKQQEESQKKTEEQCTEVDTCCSTESEIQQVDSTEDMIVCAELNTDTMSAEEVCVHGMSNTETSTSVYQSRYCELSYTETDIFAMACVVQHECGNCSEDCKRVVTCCIINRVLEPLFTENTILDVILAENQFPGCEYYNYNYNYPSEDTYNVVRSVITDGIDYANEATLFYNGTWSEWHERYRRVKDVDGMHFHARRYPV